jgi:phage terminase large subunit-like protein
MRKEKIYPNIDAWLPKGDKIAKGRPFQGIAKSGSFYLPEKGADAPEWLFDVEYQLRKFPRGKEKDIFDSIALLCQQLERQFGSEETEEKKKKPDYDEYDDLSEEKAWRMA